MTPLHVAAQTFAIVEKLLQGELVQGRVAPALHEVLFVMMPVVVAQKDKSARTDLQSAKMMSQVMIATRKALMDLFLRMMK